MDVPRRGTGLACLRSLAFCSSFCCDCVSLQDFKKEFAGASSSACDLLKKMLTFNPEKRFSVADALDHPYLAGVRSEVNKDPEGEEREPVCKAGKFDDSFEKDYPLETEMPKSLLQKHMFE